MVKREAEAGFAVGFDPADVIEENARDRAHRTYGDPEWFKLVKKDVLVDAEGEITTKGWELLNEDMSKIERNALSWLKKTFENVRDEGHGGHSGEELIGTFWFDPTDPHQAYLVELATDEGGRSERIDMVDLSYGDFAQTAFDGVSRFGGSVLGGSITFFDVKPEDMEVVQDTVQADLDRKAGRRTRELPRHAVRNAHDPKRPGWTLIFLDRYGRSIGRADLHGAHTRATAMHELVKALQESEDSLVMGGYAASPPRT